MTPHASEPLRERTALPPALAEHVGHLEAVRHETWRYRMTPAGIRLDLADAGAYYPDAYGARFESLRRGRVLRAHALLLPLMAGTGLLCWCVLSLAGVPLPWPWWAAAGALTLVGAALPPLAGYAFTHTPRLPTGLCLTPEGLCRIHAQGYQFVPWGEVREIAKRGDDRIVALGSGGAELEVIVGPRADARHQLAEAWRRGQRDLTEVRRSEAQPRFSVRGSAVTVLAVAGCCLFLWAIGVQPTKSAEGQLARDFFAKVRARHFAAARALLSPAAQRRHPLASFAETLPKEFLEQHAVSIKGITTTVGTVAGASGCVDGSVHYGEDDTRTFRMALTETADGLRIDAIVPDRQCARVR